MTQTPRKLKADSLSIEIHESRTAMGEAAATYVVGRLSHLLKNQDEVRIVVGSAPSQDDFFASLTSSDNLAKVDWSRIVVFHMDEYIGLPAAHPQSFRSYQHIHFLPKVTPRAFHEIRGEADDIDAECRRLSTLLSEKPIDLICLGIGENGHLAFNDPPADFEDPERVKVVTLDAACRQQQVNDGCFRSVDDVPTHAITLTLKVFAEAGVLSGVVPTLPKARAVHATVEGPVTSNCPATLLRDHKDSTLFLDQDAGSRLTI